MAYLFRAPPALTFQLHSQAAADLLRMQALAAPGFGKNLPAVIEFVPSSINKEAGSLRLV
jgi:hypothetical protein